MLTRAPDGSGAAVLAPAAKPDPGAARRPTRICSPSTRDTRQVEPAEVDPAAGAAGRFSASTTREPDGKVVDPRAAYLPATSTVTLPPEPAETAGGRATHGMTEEAHRSGGELRPVRDGFGVPAHPEHDERRRARPRGPRAPRPAAPDPAPSRPARATSRAPGRPASRPAAASPPASEGGYDDRAAAPSPPRAAAPAPGRDRRRRRLVDPSQPGLVELTSEQLEPAACAAATCSCDCLCMPRR